MEMKSIYGIVLLIILEDQTVITTTKLQSIVVCEHNTNKMVWLTPTGSNSSMLYGALRLTGGNSSFGRLEINLGDSWGSVCADQFDTLDGHVACRQLGFKGVTRISTNSSWYVKVESETIISVITCGYYYSQACLAMGHRGWAKHG